MRRARRGSVAATVAGGMALVSLILGGFLVLGRWKPARQAVAAETITAVPAFKLGQVVTVEGSGSIFVAITPEVGATQNRLSRAGDDEGLRELVLGKLLSTASLPCRVRILGFDPNPEATRRLGCDTAWVQVRVLDDDGDGDTDADGGGIAGWVDVAQLMF